MQNESEENMNEREALEKMKILFFNIKGCTHSASGQPSKRAYELAKEGQDIATQALAPQEDNGLYIPQETAQNEFFEAECTGGETDAPQERM